MQYNDYLLNIAQGTCPFCNIKKKYILERGKYFSVILSKVPYAPDHILIVPNRHIIRLKEMKTEEKDTLVLLIEKWTKKLEKIHKEVNLILKDGVVNGTCGKTIDHMHFHLIPDYKIYATISGGTRKVLSNYQLIKKTEDIKFKLKSK